MASIVAIQLYPNAYAQEHKATMVKEAETKAPKKTSKKRTNGHPGRTHTSPWRLAPVAAHQALNPGATSKKKVDPIKLVLAAAYKQLGKPYRWAATGPNSFDCSGFTMFVWNRAGVHLPHNSGAQRGATKSVPLDKMKPGDLVFSSGHVGLYVGKGKMIHAPQTGRNVSLAPIHGNAYGAGRPLP
jgi:cell wall-associated NlpC family hydrolase